MEERLCAVAAKWWPELEAMQGRERVQGVANVLGSLYGVPLALGGLVWLVARTDLAPVRQEWPVLLLVFALQYLLGQLEFSFFVEIREGTFGTFSGSLVGILTWSAVLMFGPVALWLGVLWECFDFLRQWVQNAETGSRWRLVRNLGLQVSGLTPVGLISLALYERLGGVLPLAGLAWDVVWPAFCAVLAFLLLEIVVKIPFFVYLGCSRYLALAGSASSLRGYLRFLALATGLSFFVNPFAILAAGLYAQNGVGGYLFFVVGVVLTNVVASRLSHAVEHSQQRSRELGQLEQLGRAMLDAPPDASTLPEVLQAHVPDMFPRSQIEIWTHMGESRQTLVQYPGDKASIGPSVREWLRATPDVRHFAVGESLPWSGQPTAGGVLVVPILDVETGGPVGGIHLFRKQSFDTVADLLPAVQSLAARVASALHSAQVYERTLSHQRIQQELALAGEIQASILPSRLPSVPGWQLTATLLPAHETSGDFYDVLSLPNGRYGILIADVADKGMGAALYMSLSCTLLRTYGVEYHTRPDFALRVTNDRIMADTYADMFVTVFYGVLDPASGTLTYCNAGHNPPYLLSARAKNNVQALGRTGVALGVSSDVEWNQDVVEIAQGDMLVLYTDGVIDAEDGAGAFFGRERLLGVARATLGLPAQEVRDALVAEVGGFVGDVPQFDDMAVMVLVRSPEAIAQESGG